MIYIATFNLFFHFYAQPLFAFVILLVYTLLILSLLQLLLSLVVNSIPTE